MRFELILHPIYMQLRILLLFLVVPLTGLAQNQLVPDSIAALPEHLARALPMVEAKDNDNCLYGMMDPTFTTWYIEPRYERIVNANSTSPYLMVQLNGNFGLINRKGEEILAPDYNGMQLLTDTTWQTRKNWLWGITHVNGTELHPHTITHLSRWMGNMAIASMSAPESLKGLLHKNGTMVLPPAQNRISYEDDFTRLWWQIRTPAGTGIYKEGAGWLVAPKYEALSPIDGRKQFIALQAGKVGLIDWEGHELLPPQFDGLQPINACFIQARNEHRYALIRTNNLSAPLKWYDEVRDNLSTATQRSSCTQLFTVRNALKYGLIDAAGNALIPTISTTPPKPIGDAYLLTVDALKGLYKPGSGWVLAAEYRALWMLSQTVPTVVTRQASGLGLASASGEILAPCQWDTVEWCTPQLLKFRVGHHWGIATWTGNIISDPVIDEIRASTRGVVYRVNQLWGILDNAGKELVPPTYSYLGISQNANSTDGMVAVIPGKGYELLTADGKPANGVPVRVSMAIHPADSAFAIPRDDDTWQFFSKTGQLLFQHTTREVVVDELAGGWWCRKPGRSYRPLWQKVDAQGRTEKHPPISAIGFTTAHTFKGKPWVYRWLRHQSGETLLQTASAPNTLHRTFGFLVEAVNPDGVLLVHQPFRKINLERGLLRGNRYRMYHLKKGFLHSFLVKLDYVDTPGIWYKKMGRYGLMDCSGKRITKARFSGYYPFAADSQAVVQRGKRFGIINANGQWVKRPTQKLKSLPYALLDHLPTTELHYRGELSGQRLNLQQHVKSRDANAVRFLNHLAGMLLKQYQPLARQLNYHAYQHRSSGVEFGNWRDVKRPQRAALHYQKLHVHQHGAHFFSTAITRTAGNKQHLHHLPNIVNYYVHNGRITMLHFNALFTDPESAWARIELHCRDAVAAEKGFEMQCTENGGIPQQPYHWLLLKDSIEIQISNLQWKGGTVPNQHPFVKVRVPLGELRPYIAPGSPLAAALDPENQ